MSLIFGLCLPRKIYLVSDSRLTSIDSTNRQSFVDDFGKWVDINPRLGVVVANSAHQASWTLRKILPEVRAKGMDWDFTALEAYLHKNLKTIANEYYAETGELRNSACFIFGGFEKTKKLEIEASRLGEAMSAPVRAAGEGVTVYQSIDPDIINAFSKVLADAGKKGHEVRQETMFEVDAPRPRVIAVTIRPTNKGAEVLYEDVLCYDGIVFNPAYKTERVRLPAELIGKLEYRDKSGEQGQQTIYEDQRHVLLYVDKLIDEKKWPTVGGEIVPLLIMPNSSGIATGHYIRVKNGQQYFGGIGVNEKGEVHYYDKQGRMIPYRFIYNYLEGKDPKGNALL